MKIEFQCPDLRMVSTPTTDGGLRNHGSSAGEYREEGKPSRRFLLVKEKIFWNPKSAVQTNNGDADHERGDENGSDTGEENDNNGRDDQ